MSEQNCAARKALEEIANHLYEKQDLARCREMAREALAAPCGHAAEVERLRTACDGAEFAIRQCVALKEWGPSTPEHLASRVATLCNLYANCVDTLGKIADQRDRLRAKLEKAQALNHRWNRAASQHGPCGSEFHDDPERVFARVLEARQFASEVARVKAEKRANTELDTLKAETTRVLEPFANWFHAMRLKLKRDEERGAASNGAWGSQHFHEAEKLLARLAQEKPEVPR